MAKIQPARLAAGIAAALFAFAAAPGHADTPISFTYTGTLMRTGIDMNSDGDTATHITAHMKGSFGASLGTIVSEFYADGGTCPTATAIHMSILHATAVTTFSNGDQLWGTIEEDDGGLCLDVVDGSFVGEVSGTWKGGTGRFKNASGSFTNPFSGTQLTAFTMGYGYGPIKGIINGTLED